MNIINGVPMYYFDQSEFVRPAKTGDVPIDWSPCMDRRLLILLDSLRYQWGRPITISPAAGTIGRLSGTSTHSIKKDGICRAVDVYPVVKGRLAVNGFYQLARRVGFTGIGIYPEWRNGPGVHLDTRTDRRPGDPAIWGYVGGKFVSLEAALAALS